MNFQKLKISKRQLLSLLMIVVALPVFAEIVEIGFVKYECDSNTGTATCLGIGDHVSGSFDISESVILKGRTYIVTSVATKAFYGNDVGSLTIPATIEEIGTGAFKCNGLGKVFCHIEKPLVIDDNVFENYSATLYVPGRSLDLYKLDKEWGKFKTILALDPADVGESRFVTIDGIEYYCDAETGTAFVNKGTYCGGDITIREEVTLNGQTYKVTKIRENAFAGCDYITSVIIPNSIVEMGASAFRSCDGLRSVVIGTSIRKINDSTFGGCNSLISLTFLGNHVPEFISGAFWGCQNLKEIHISDLEAWCKVYFYCALNYMQHYGNEDLDCSNPLSIAKNLYLGDELITDLVIPDGIEHVKSGLFACCESLKSVVIPNTVTQINCLAFYNCDNLTSLTISKSVSAIGAYAFKCKNLNTVFCYRENPPAIFSYGITLIGTPHNQGYKIYDAFTNYDATLYVPLGSGDLYRQHSIWGKFKNIVETDFVGVDGVEADEELLPTDYYNLNGVKVATAAPGATPQDLPAGVYITRQGAKTAKTVIL